MRRIICAIWIAAIVAMSLRAWAQPRPWGLNPPALPDATQPASRPTVKVAAIQMMSEFGKPELNRRKAEGLIRQAAKGGAKIVVLPETAITGYMSYDLQTTWQANGWELTTGLTGVSPETAAESVPGPSTRQLGKLARELGIYLTVPLVEKDVKTGRYFNTIVLMSPAGGQLLHYRKLNPWPYAEKGWATSGDRGLAYADTEFGRLGLLVCYDINYEPPNLKKAGVDTLLYCIAWVDAADSQWYQSQLPEIARRNRLNIIGANWTVPAKPSWHGYGQSCVLSCEGKALARAAKDIGEEVVFSELPIPVQTRRP